MKHSIADQALVISFWFGIAFLPLIRVFDIDLPLLFTIYLAMACFMFPCIYMHFKIRDTTRSMGYLLLPFYFLVRPSARNSIEFRFRENKTGVIDVVEKLGHLYYVILAGVLVILSISVWVIKGYFPQELGSNNTFIGIITTGITSIFVLWRIHSVK